MSSETNIISNTIDVFDECLEKKKMTQVIKGTKKIPQVPSLKPVASAIITA